MRNIYFLLKHRNTLLGHILPLAIVIIAEPKDLLGVENEDNKSVCVCVCSFSLDSSRASKLLP